MRSEGTVDCALDQLTVPSEKVSVTLLQHSRHHHAAYLLELPG